MTDDHELHDDPVHALLEACLAAARGDRAQVMERLCEEHPEHAQRLRSRFERLERAGLLESLEHDSAPGPGNDDRAETDGEGSPSPGDDEKQIGPYRILETLGEGGMGTVYLAEQREPVRRRVALKVIKLGMDTKQILARFEAERQALAIMDHPGIAKVLDAGSTQQGRSYFAMEFVPGIPLTTFCDQHELGVRERLELFVKVCTAIQHAHHKGIIHRDLKPSNVLVAEGPDGPAPKIIDFGLARATDLRLTERTMFTRHGTVVGTLEYMSPEQADLSCTGVDTRTDIYSMGVILYELLVGALPLDPEELRREGLYEMQRRIREEEPPKPSTRVATPTPVTVEASRRRRTDIHDLVRTLRGDLDWITIKALEKQRSRRYQTAAELAADIERYLRDEPVLASPPSVRYRLVKLYRRNRVRVVAAATVLLALLVGLVVSTSLYFDVRAAQRREAAARATADVHRDAMLLRALLADAERIWPAWPEDVAEADRWLAQARPMLARIDAYRTDLAALQSRATRVDGDPRARPRQQAIEQRLALLEQARADFDRYLRGARSPGNRTDHTMNALNSLLEGMPAQIAEARRRAAIAAQWQFASRHHEEQHYALAEVVAGRDGLAESVAEVTLRRQRALAVDRVCFDEHGADWDATIQVIAADPVYGGLRIAWQRGLYPLGRDPDSGLFEFGHFLSGEPPERDAGSGRLAIGPDTGLVFVLIPAGAIETGSHRIRGRRVEPFLLSKYELTQGQWLRLTGTNPSHYPVGVEIGGVPVDPRHPVTRVSWHDAFGVLSRLGMTLPSLAQWEFAARAGSKWRWLTGDDPSSLEKANLADASFTRRWPGARAFEHDDGFPIHAPVGSFPANAFGVHDACGNVAEWALDAVKLTRSGKPYDNEGLRRGIVGWSFQSVPDRAKTDAGWWSIIRDVATGCRPARELELAVR